MFSKKKFVLLNKINILIIILLILIKLLPITLSRYESEKTGNIDTNIAFYLLKTDYQTQRIKLTSLSPSDEPYIYSFKIMNYQDDTNGDVDIEYYLSLKTTTNLPLRYELYMNEDYQDSTATNLITDDNTKIEKDDSETYFKTITLDKEIFHYIEPKENTYTLLIYYDKSNDNPIYQDNIDSIRIIVESKQITD